jgi:hypothetical protein
LRLSEQEASTSNSMPLPPSSSELQVCIRVALEQRFRHLLLVLAVSLHNSVKRIISYQLKHIRQTHANSPYTQYLWLVKRRGRATALGEGTEVTTEHEARRSRPHPRSVQAPDFSRDAKAINVAELIKQARANATAFRAALKLSSVTKLTCSSLANPRSFLRKRRSQRVVPLKVTLILPIV